MSSSVCRPVTALVVAIALSAASFAGARAETLRAGGTGATAEVLKLAGAAFEAREPGTTFELIASLGSSGGIAAVADGAIDFAVVSRTLKPEETARALTAFVFARSPFVLASSQRVPNGLKSADVAGFFAAPNSLWADGTPVRVILRPKSESDTTLLGQAFPGMVAAIEQVRARGDVPLAATDQDNAQMAEQIAGSLIAASYTQITTEKRKLRFVAIDGVAPTLENFERGTYSYSKDFHFVAPAKRSATVERFLALLRSAEGMTLLRDAGLLAVVD